MGLIDAIFRPTKAKESIKALNKAKDYFATVTGYEPVFHTWNGAIYESELVRSAIDARARHISKLKFEITGSGQPQLQTKLRQGPNQWTTWSQFLYRVSTILDNQNTCFVTPVFDADMRITGYFPVMPNKCSIVEYNDEPWLRYEFKRGQYAAVEMRKVAVLTKFQYKRDFFGTDNEALNETLKLIHLNNQGIEEAVKSSATYRFMAQLNNFTKHEDLVKERERFSDENLANDGRGLLLFPNTYQNIQQIKTSPFTVDKDQMELIRTNVYDYFGVNEEVLKNQANGNKLDAFFNGAIEPFAVQFSEAMTMAIFSERERAQGSYFIANANRLQYMSVTAKVQMAKELGDRGAILIDEIRDLFNYPPLPDGAGQVAPIRGEYKATDELGGGENATES